MKYFKLVIVLFMSSFWCEILGIYIPSNDTVLDDPKSSHILDMKKTYNIDPAVNIHDKTSQYAEACKCDKGTCVEKDGKMVCTCPAEFGFYKYEQIEECRPCECGKESNCTFDVNLFSTIKNCICKEGYKVVNNYCKDSCTKKPCKNGGTCKVDGKSFKCICRSPYSGNICEKDPCTKKPCKNGGTCKVDRKSFKCVCRSPYSGNTCEKDPCTSKPCKNRGTCKVNGKYFKCECKKPFSGKTCEEVRKNFYQGEKDPQRAT